MGKLKNIIITVVAILIVGIGAFYLSEYAKDKYFREITFENYENLKGNDKQTIIYTGSTSDTETIDEVKAFASSYGLTLKYLDTEKLTDEQLKEIYEDNEVNNNIILVSNNKINYNYSGDFSSNKLHEFFVEKGILPRGLTDINVDTYLELLNSTDKHVIFIGRDTCHYCELFHPVADEVAKKYDVAIYYLNTDNFVNDDWTRFTSSESFYEENQWGTPLTILVSNNKIIDYINGYVEKDKLVTFLQENGMID